MSKCPGGNPFQSPFELGGATGKDDQRLLDIRFNRFVTRSLDLSPLWPSIDREWREEARQIFDTEGSYGRGEEWQPLKESTIRDRVRKGFDEGPILERTGTLRESVISPSASFAWRESSPRSLFMGTQVPYAVYHQSREPRHKIPRRAFMYITRMFRLFIIRAIHRYAVKGEV